MILVEELFIMSTKWKGNQDLVVDVRIAIITNIKQQLVKSKGRWDSLSSVYQEMENVVRSTAS